MPVHPWQLRADVRPLDEAAARWSELGRMMTQRADDLVAAARHALDGWEASAAESYDEHRRQVVANLDRFTTLADQLAGSLRAVSTMITETQKELDQRWVEVSLVPHQEVGPERRLVFSEGGEDDRAKVSRSELEADEVRGRLRGALDQESTRLRTARAELIQVRATLVDLAGGAFPTLLGAQVEEAGAGIIGPASTSVRGSAESGVTAALAPGPGLAPVGPLSVSMPHLSGLAAGIVPVIGTAASGAAGRVGRVSSSQPQGGGLPMGGGMAAGAARSGSAARGGGAGRRTGSGSLATPAPAGKDAQARAEGKPGSADAAREAERAAQKEGKRAELAERRAARAARKAAREAERKGERKGVERDETTAEVDSDPEGDGEGDDFEARPTNLTVVEVAPGERPRGPRL